MSRPAIVSVFLVLCCAGVAWAQHVTTGAIAGRVQDASGAPVAGATVTVNSQQGSKTLVTDAEGRFRAPYLTPGRYSLRVDLEGFQPAERHDVAVALGQRVALQFTLNPGSFEGTLDVTGSLPVIDFSTSTAGLGMDRELLARVPVGRRLSETLYLAPAVTDSGGAGRENPSISGGSGLENQYVVDGVNITDPRYGALGLYSGFYGSLGNGVTYDFIEEIQVRTAGAEAEFDQSTGGMVNVVTKSGSNELRGSVFGYLTPEALEGDRELVVLDNGAVNTTGEQRSELGFTVGGPLLHDRLFYFLAASAQRQRTTFIAPEGFPLYDLGEVDRVRNVLSYAAKATFSLSEGHRLEASFFGDPAEADNGPQSADVMTSRDTGAFSALDYGGHNQSLGYQGVLTTSWLVEATAARAYSTFEEFPEADEWTVTDETTRPAQTSGGKGRYDKYATGENLQLRAKATQLAGRHEVRYGVSFEDVNYDVLRSRTGPPITLANGVQTLGGVSVAIQTDPSYGRIYRVTGASLGGPSITTHRYTGVFAQDRVLLGTRLSLSAGLRWETQRVSGSDASYRFADNWVPRLGFIYDPNGAGRIKLYGSYGTFYAKIPNNLSVYLFQGGGRVLLADYFDAELTEPVPDGVLALGATQHLLVAGTEPAQVDPGAGTTYIREAAAGVELQALPDLGVGVRYVWRDMPRVLEDVSNAAMVLYFTGGIESVEYSVTNPRDGYPATVNDIGAFEDPIRRYQSLELTANKRFSNRWTLLGSYRWSDLEGTYEGFYRNDTGRSAPAMSGLFDFPTDDPSYTAIGGPVYGFRGDIRYLGDPGPLPTDRTHQLKLHGAYTFDVGLTVGAGVYVSSGTPLTPMAANPVYNRAGDIPEAPRGSGIETEDGFMDRTPTVSSLDLHLDYVLPIGRGRGSIVLDVFNLLDEQTVTEYDQNTERRLRVLNQDFGRRTAFQEPRQVRIGVRFEL